MKKKQKNYDPFKMWGSYVGATILILYVGLSHKYLGYFATQPIDVFDMLFVLSIPLGFLIGWGIHSLIRRFK